MPLANPAAIDELTARFQDRSAKIGIIGLGYVGLPLALVFHRARFSVTGFDIDAHKVACLRRGESYIKHIGAGVIAEVMATGRLAATEDFDGLRTQDAIIICVPTPLDEKHEPDLSYIETTARAIAARLRPGQLVVLESSTYPGTTDEVLVPLLERSGVSCSFVVAGKTGTRARAAAAGTEGQGTSSHAAPAHQRAYVAYSPEREDPGNQEFTTRHIPKLVGGVDAESTRLAVAMYGAAFDRTVSVSSVKIAEMAKILENTYRCVNIALVNELKQLCLRMDIDIWQVIAAAATKPFGFHAFYPGPGLGGHCIPIDPFYLSWKAREFDFTARFIQLAGEINTEMPARIVEAVEAALQRRGSAASQARILILGVAYKRDIDDLRESPALKIISLLRERGSTVNYYDPHCPRVDRGRQNDFEMESVDFTPERAADYDAVVIVTDHSSVDYAAVVAHARLVVDTRNACSGLESNRIVRC